MWIAIGQWAPSVKTSVAYVNARQNVTTTKCIATSGRQSGLTCRYQLASVISHPGQAQWIQEQSGQGGRDGGYAQTLQLFPRLIGCLTCQQQRSALVPLYLPIFLWDQPATWQQVDHTGLLLPAKEQRFCYVWVYILGMSLPFLFTRSSVWSTSVGFHIILQ